MNLAGDKLPDMLYRLARSIINPSLCFQQRPVGCNQTLRTLEMEIPAFTSGFEQIKENKKKYASDSCVAFLYSSVAKYLRESFHSLMFEK